MEIVYKIVLIGLITAVATMLVRPVRNDFALLIAITGGIIILGLLLNYLTGIFSTLKNIVNITGLSGNLYTLLLKIVGIGYLIEFTAGICNDTGNASLGDKVLLGGKIIIMVMAMPIVTSILQIIMELLPA